MKNLFAASILIALSFIPGASAQVKGSHNTKNVPPRPTTSTLDPSIGKVFLSGTVVLDDGSALTESVAIETVCKTRKRIETYTDLRGNFSFQFGPQVSYLGNGGLADADASGADTTPRQPQLGDSSDCEVQAVLAGFTSQTIPLAGRLSTMMESGDLGRISLHRLGKVEGLTISATSAQAPAGAKKAFEKGHKQKKKEKWDDAQKSFQQAVALYPGYALAWFELGSVQLHQGEIDAARFSWNQALAADRKFVSPYLGLAELAGRDANWQQVMNYTDQVLALDPVSFPQAWYRNAVAKYYLKNFEAAEKSARQGLTIDEHHQIPKLEYLLGVVLAARHQYPQASEHIQKYLQLETRPSDVDEAKKQLAEIARVSGIVPATAEPKP
jgi:Tetratricopeptide repeat